MYHNWLRLLTQGFNGLECSVCGKRADIVLGWPHAQDYCPGSKPTVAQNQTYTPAIAAGWGVTFKGTIEKEGIDVTKPYCSHDYVPYLGLKESYEFCKKCDRKKGVL